MGALLFEAITTMTQFNVRIRELRSKRKLLGIPSLHKKMEIYTGIFHEFPPRGHQCTINVFAKLLPRDQQSTKGSNQ